MFGFDAHAYWAVDLSNLYGNSTGNTSDLDAFRYTPAAGQAFSVFGLVPWEVFFAIYFAAMIGALIWLTGRTWLVLLAFPPIPLELYHGNIHLFMAVAIVLGFRYPVAWTFIVLTKVTPGVGALWFAFRREWRGFAIAVVSTVLIVGVSYAIAPDLWRQYVSTMVDNLDYDPGHPYPIPIPLPIRLAVAVAVVAWGARTDRRWTVPVAATISLPIIWFHGFALLVAAIPLWRQDRARRAQPERPPRRSETAICSLRPGQPVPSRDERRAAAGTDHRHHRPGRLVPDELLLDKGYEVHGLIRRSSSFSTGRIDHLVTTPRSRVRASFSTSRSDRLVVADHAPPPGQAGGGLQPRRPEPRQGQLRDAGVHRRDGGDGHAPDARGRSDRGLADPLLPGGSSEMFGKVLETPQRETTPFNPRSPYAVAKVFATGSPSTTGRYGSMPRTGSCSTTNRRGAAGRSSPAR
jgi:hypothetical protein